jgi:hypothetical protein
MLKKLAKYCAKFALGYLPEVFCYIMKMATDKTKDSDRAKAILRVVKQISTEALIISEVMEDGNITETEEAQIKMRAEVLAEEINALL